MQSSVYLSYAPETPLRWTSCNRDSRGGRYNFALSSMVHLLTAHAGHELQPPLGEALRAEVEKHSCAF